MAAGVFGIDNPELPNLLNLLEAVDITNLLFSKPFLILVGFGTFWNHFHTRIHTQPGGDFESFEGTVEENIAAYDSPLY